MEFPTGTASGIPAGAVPIAVTQGMRRVKHQLSAQPERTLQVQIAEFLLRTMSFLLETLLVMLPSTSQSMRR